MAKKKQGSIMDQFQQYTPAWEEPGEEKKDDGDQIKTLTERLAKLEAEREVYSKQQTYQQYQQPAAALQTNQQAASTEVNLEGMPDPVTDTKEYTQELIKRMNAANDAKLQVMHQQTQAERERENLATNLWEGFQKAKPEWAEHDMLVGAAAQQVSADLVRRGVNVVQLLKSQPDVYYNEVATILEKKYPQLKSEGGEGDGEEDGEEDNGRSASVFGGTPGKGSAGAGGPPSSEDDNTAFLRGLAEMRYKAGVR